MEPQAFIDSGIHDERVAKAASLVAAMVRAAQQIAAHTALKSDDPAVLAAITQAIASTYLSMGERNG